MVQRLDALHLNLLLETSIYATSAVHEKSHFTMKPALVFHVADMLRRGILDLEVDRSALEQFVTWLESWPDEEKEMLRPTLRSLEETYPSPGLWGRVSMDFCLDTDVGQWLHARPPDSIGIRLA